MPQSSRRLSLQSSRRAVPTDSEHGHSAMDILSLQLSDSMQSTVSRVKASLPSFLTSGRHTTSILQVPNGTVPSTQMQQQASEARIQSSSTRILISWVERASWATQMLKFQRNTSQSSKFLHWPEETPAFEIWARTSGPIFKKK